MPQNIYVARQPIVDVEQNIQAYELLFRCVQENGSILSLFDDNLLATSRVLVNTLNHIGIKNLVGEHKAFINVDEEMLLDNMITTIPKERFVIELLETLVVSDTVIKRVQELKALGYTFAIDDANCSNDFIHNFSPLFPYIDVLKLDLKLINLDNLKKHLHHFKEHNFKLLAEKVETQEEFETYKSFGCSLFQGYYFAKAKIISQKAIDPHYISIFKLIQLLDKDVELEELSLAFEKQADITLQLLRYMNSGQMHLKIKIKSIKHAITLLGKHPLKQWLLLIAYSTSNDAKAKPENSLLLQMAASRSKLMYELMNTLHHEKKLNHEAAFVGLLSLIDALLHIPIEDVLNELHVDKVIVTAIVQGQGELGQLLELVQDVEKFKLEEANEIAQKLHIPEQNFQEALLQSMKQDTHE